MQLVHTVSTFPMDVFKLFLTQSVDLMAVTLLMSNTKVSLLTHLLPLNLTCPLPHLFTSLPPNLFTSLLPYLFTSLLPNLLLSSLHTNQLPLSLYLPFTSLPLLPFTSLHLHLSTTEPPLTRPLLLPPENTPTPSLPLKLPLHSLQELPELPVSNLIW